MVIQPNSALASWLGNFSSPTQVRERPRHSAPSRHAVGKAVIHVGELQEAHEHIGADGEHREGVDSHTDTRMNGPAGARGPVSRRKFVLTLQTKAVTRNQKCKQRCT